MHSWFPLSKLKRSRIVGKHFRQNIKPFKPKKLVMTSPTNAVCSFRLWGRGEGGSLDRTKMLLVNRGEKVVDSLIRWKRIVQFSIQNFCWKFLSRRLALK